MKEFDGLYPLHEQFVKQHNQPSKFQHNWETINMDYIGSFFTVMIGYHLGGWLLRRAMFGTAGAHVLSVLNPLFGGATPYAMPLLHAMWGVILFEYFVAMPYNTFVNKPQKLRELQEYYQLGNQQNNLINGTYLNYYRQERNGHFINYAFEMSMHAIFVGWWVYSLKVFACCAQKSKKIICRNFSSVWASTIRLKMHTRTSITFLNLIISKRVAPNNKSTEIERH